MESADKTIKYLGFIDSKILKTIVAVFICFTISYLRDTEPFYSVISAMITMQHSVSESLKTGKNRMFSSFIGSLFGVITIIVITYFDVNIPSYNYYILLTLLIIPIIYICTYLGFPNSINLSCVLFLVITLIRINDRFPIYFVFNRIIETLIGIIISIIINKFI